jgi:hypothetical protein
MLEISAGKKSGSVLSRFASLSDQVAAELEVDNTILDGEVIATDEARSNGTRIFNA